MAPVPSSDCCELRPRFLRWISPACFALGPMCTTSTPFTYIQCTGKPKSGCGPLCMPSTRAYQSRVASMSSAATRKCSMCETGMPATIPARGWQRLLRGGFGSAPALVARRAGCRGVAFLLLLLLRLRLVLRLVPLLGLLAAAGARRLGGGGLLPCLGFLRGARCLGDQLLARAILVLAL